MYVYNNSLLLQQQFCSWQTYVCTESPFFQYYERKLEVPLPAKSSHKWQKWVVTMVVNFHGHERHTVEKFQFQKKYSNKQIKKPIA